MAPLKSTNQYTTSSLHEPVKILANQESLAYFPPKTIPEFFHECCEKFKNSPALAYDNSSEEQGSNDKSWNYVTYGEYEGHVEKAALALIYLGVEQRTSVSVLAYNSPEWFYIQFGALRINAVVAGIYTTNSAEAVFHILSTSDSSVVIVDSSHQMAKIREIRSRLPMLRAAVQLYGPYDFSEKDQRDGYYRWEDLMRLNLSDTLGPELVLRERNVAPNECALLIYTSGTTGMPKGVMCSHDGILYLTHAIYEKLDNLYPCKERTVTYLPLSHIAPQYFDIFMSMENGSLVYFADKNALKSTLTSTMLKARPTRFFGVPRVFEKFHEKFMQMEATLSLKEKYLRSLARSMMMHYHLDRIEGKPTSSWKYWWASKLTQRMKESLGLDQLKLCMVAAAPTSLELKHFFLSLDLPLTEAFGMSETSGGILYNLDMANLATAGKPLHGIETKILNANAKGEGELLVRGRCNFMGYVKEPEKTKNAFTMDNWIFTGDLSSIDNDGNVYINGRLKELLITAGGENIPPILIEASIKKELPCISNVFVIGDKRKYLTVLLTFKTEMDPHSGYPLDKLLNETIEWLQQLGFHYTHLSQMLHIDMPENLQNFNPCSVHVKLDEKIKLALKAGIERYNEKAISNAHRVQYFRVLPHDFSFATDELGPTLKTRRNIIIEKYSKIIDQMYKQ
ncbi:long-chain-fatty-acid--CoA ligase heimdall-like [Haematobia irritans]|uniref:long-chain-fatty-acid--CoA ligase heimdall-like n=1 Tax=Haematobia irritans TaxID=7368 RepID=UPI003F4F4A72